LKKLSSLDDVVEESYLCFLVGVKIHVRTVSTFVHEECPLRLDHTGRIVASSSLALPAPLPRLREFYVVVREARHAKPRNSRLRRNYVGEYYVWKIRESSVTRPPGLVTSRIYVGKSTMGGRFLVKQQATRHAFSYSLNYSRDDGNYTCRCSSLHHTYR
jgi:hypothetical protein